MLRTEPLFQHASGVPVFPDHADPDAFWYLPAHVDFARRPADGSPILSFIKYRTPRQDQGGGLLSFQVDLTLPETVRRSIESKLQAHSRQPRLMAVPFTEGSVQCVALDAGPQAAGAGNAAPSGPPLVSRVLGTAKPSLQGNNSAIFTLALSPDGAEVVAAALKGGATILGVIYQLDYTAMQPPLRVKVTARMQEIYRSLGASLAIQHSIAKADLALAIERLKAEGKLVIEKIDTIGSEASAREVEAATKLFTDMLIRDWFRTVLVPGKPRITVEPAIPGTGTTGTDGGDGGVFGGSGGVFGGSGGGSDGSNGVFGG